MAKAFLKTIIFQGFIGILIFSSCSSQETSSAREEKRTLATKTFMISRVIPSVLTRKAPKGSKYVTPQSTELLSLLKRGEIDYFFSHRHFARQNHLQFIEFPRLINLGSEEYLPLYQKVEVRLPDGTIKHGNLIHFALTISPNAIHPKMALEFLKMTMGSAGERILKKNHLVSVNPARTKNLQEVPTELRGFFQHKNFIPPETKIGSKNKIKLYILHMDSLKNVFLDLEKAFEEKFPLVDIVNQNLKGRTALKSIPETLPKIDIVALTDYTDFDHLLPRVKVPWYAIFAQDEIVLAYRRQSRYSEEINPENWFEVLARKDVTMGRLDPNENPAGYHTLLFWELSRNFYPLNKETRDQNFQKKISQGKKPVLVVYVNEKVYKNFTYSELKSMHTSKFTVSNHPIYRGISLQSFFEEIGLPVNSSDEIFVEGRGQTSFPYEEALKNQIGLVPTYNATPKLAAKRGEYQFKKSRIGHVHSIKIIQK